MRPPMTLEDELEGIKRERRAWDEWLASWKDRPTYWAEVDGQIIEWDGDVGNLLAAKEGPTP